MELPFTKFELVFIFIAFTVFSMFSIAVVYQITWKTEDRDLHEEYLKSRLKSRSIRRKLRSIGNRDSQMLSQVA